MPMAFQAAFGAASRLRSFVPNTQPAFWSIVRSKISGDVGARTPLASLVAVSICNIPPSPEFVLLLRCVLASTYIHFICTDTLLCNTTAENEMESDRFRVWLGYELFRLRQTRTRAFSQKIT